MEWSGERGGGREIAREGNRYREIVEGWMRGRESEREKVKVRQWWRKRKESRRGRMREMEGERGRKRGRKGGETDQG